MLEPNFNPFPTLETERLLLRRYVPEDAEGVYSYRSNANAMKHIAKPLQTSLDEAKQMVERINGMIDTNDGIGWAITLKEQPEKIIGGCSFHVIQKNHYRAEIGYMLHPDYWKQGIVSEAVKAIIEYGFNEMKLHSIEAHIDPINIASEKVLTKFGFVKEGYFKENYYYNGEFLDTAVFSLLKP